MLCLNGERIVVFLKRVGSFLSITYKVTHFYASQPTSTIIKRLRVIPTSHDWLDDYRAYACGRRKSARRVNGLLQRAPTAFC